MEGLDLEKWDMEVFCMELLETVEDVIHSKYFSIIGQKQLIKCVHLVLEVAEGLPNLNVKG
eukprot:14871836-Ditylum_brightwellii.AAC.1